MGMLKGPAIGGPCEGAKLSALAAWDGRVERSRKSAKGLPAYHPGHYKWDWDYRAWIWLETKTEKAGTPRLFG